MMVGRLCLLGSFAGKRLLSAGTSLPRVTLVHHPFSLDGKPIESKHGVISPAEDKFAVIEFSGTQYKVTIDDTIVANKISGVDIGDTYKLNKVLLVGSASNTVLGRPYINEAEVIATVEEIAKDKKVMILKHRRRKHSRRLRGFRRQITVLRITDIVLKDLIDNNNSNSGGGSTSGEEKR